MLAKWPFPADLDWLDNTHRNEYIATLPDSAFWIVIASHVFGAFFAGLIASLVTRKDRFTSGIIAVTILFVMVLIYNFTHEYPGWFLMLDVLLTAVAGFAAASFGRTRRV